MSLREMILIRLAQLEAFLDIIQLLKHLENTRNAREVEQEIFHQRKDLRILLNIMELEKICQCQYLQSIL